LFLERLPPTRFVDEWIGITVRETNLDYRKRKKKGRKGAGRKRGVGNERQNNSWGIFEY
jgi:hypothetical protein